MTLKKDNEKEEETCSPPRGKRTLMTHKQILQRQNEKEYDEEIKHFLEKYES